MMQTKKTIQITFRCQKTIEKKIPKGDKRSGIRTQFINTSLSNQLDFLDYKKETQIIAQTPLELIYDLTEKQSECKEGIIKFFQLMQRNRSTLDISFEEKVYFKQLLEKIRNA